MAVEDFTIKSNDTRPKLVAQLIDDVGAPEEGPIDLTTVKSVDFIMRQEGKEDVDGPKVKAACEIEDAVKGIVSYSWVSEDTDTVGTFQGEFEITWNDDGVETIPNDDYFKVIIVDDLG